MIQRKRCCDQMKPKFSLCHDLHAHIGMAVSLPLPQLRIQFFSLAFNLEWEWCVHYCYHYYYYYHCCWFIVLCFGALVVFFKKKFFIKKIGQDGWIELGPLTHAEYDQKNTIHTVKHRGGKNILFVVCLLRAQDDFTTGKKAGPWAIKSWMTISFS